MTDNLKSFASKSLQKNLIMRESFLAGKPFLFKNLFWTLYMQIERINGYKQIQKPCIGKDLLSLLQQSKLFKAIKHELLSGTEVFHEHEQPSDLLLCYLDNYILVHQMWTYGSRFLKLLSQSKQPVIRKNQERPTNCGRYSFIEGLVNSRLQPP